MIQNPFFFPTYENSLSGLGSELMWANLWLGSYSGNDV
jgi:hypothetical protein